MKLDLTKLTANINELDIDSYENDIALAESELSSLENLDLKNETKEKISNVYNEIISNLKELNNEANNY